MCICVAGVAQLVKHLTEKPGTILTLYSLESPMRQGIFLPELTFAVPVRTLLRCMYSPCAQSHASASVHTLTNLKQWQPQHCLDTKKYYTH